MRVTVSFQSISEADVLDLGDAFWLKETPENRAIAERIWASGKTDPNSALFKRAPAVSAKDDIFRILEDIDLHHPGWSEIQFLDSALNQEHQETLQQLGLQGVLGTRGVVVRRK